MRPIPDIAVSFVKAHEGCRLTAYGDVGGVYTVGYGHTGPEVKAGLCIPQIMADLYLRQDLETAAKRLVGVVSEGVILTLSEHQYAALLSFVFNVGCPRTARIWVALNALQFDRVPAELMRWTYAGGKVVQGLVNRRAAEVALWNTPDDPPPPVVAAALPPEPVTTSANAGFLSRIWNRFAA